jgi:3-oxoacyl-[acyl-carrier-protein] synthase-3
MTHSRIIGTGRYLPEKVVSNKDLELTIDTSDQWIQERTGIAQRHVAAEGERSSHMGLAAALQALEMAEVSADEIDLIVVGTTTPDKSFPSTACLIQKQLGTSGPAAFDVQAACSGFIYALDLADRQIRTGAASKALVIGAEKLSKLVNWDDRGTAVLFGDGAGAVVLSASQEEGVLATHIHSEGEFEDLLYVCTEDGFIKMDGNAVFRKAVSKFDEMAREMMANHDLDDAEIDWLVPHQANLRIIKAAAKKVGLPMERVIVTVDQHANTSSASIPLALDTAVRDGRIKKGDLLLMEAFGAGFTWGSALVRF